MSFPNRGPLDKLLQLKQSSSKFPDKLSNILYGQEYQQWAKNTLGDDVVSELVDWLDGALDNLDPASPASRKCMRELRHVCGARKILPASSTLSSQVSLISHHPVASGGSGDVYEGTLNNLKVCVKRIRVYSQDSSGEPPETFFKEAVVWKRLKHKNIVPLIHISVVPFQLISEWMPGGDLTEYVGKHPEADRLSLLCDVTEGLLFLHSRNMVHGDLKGPNILIDATHHAQITDFGLATVTQNLDSMRSTLDHGGHTARWTAPEILNDVGTYSKEADVFSFAMVMIEAFTGAVPFSRSLPAAAMLAIMGGKRPPRPTHPTFTHRLWALMQRCWDQDPPSRPEVSEIWRVLSGTEPPPLESHFYGISSASTLSVGLGQQAVAPPFSKPGARHPPSLQSSSLTASRITPQVSSQRLDKFGDLNHISDQAGGAGKSLTNLVSAFVDRTRPRKDSGKGSMVPTPSTRRPKAQYNSTKGAKVSNFPEVVSQALTNIGEGGGMQSPLLATIIALESGDNSVHMTEAGTLVETLDQLAENIQDVGVRDRCLDILSEACYKNVILPKSYIVSDVVQEKKWKISGDADIFTGKRGQTDVCIKVFRKHEDATQGNIKGVFYRYVVRWKYVSHENVLPFLGVSEIVPPFGFVSPLMPKSNILDYTRTCQDANRLLLLENAACGLVYLHSKHIVHGGVNPGNILVNEQGVACLGDYQIAGVVRYMAPEQVNPGLFGSEARNPQKAIDVHSFAMIAYEVLTGIEPFSGITGEGPLAVRITDGTRPTRPKAGAPVQWLPDKIWDMLEHCWVLRPDSRPPIGAVRQVFQVSATATGCPALRNMPLSQPGGENGRGPDNKQSTQERSRSVGYSQAIAPRKDSRKPRLHEQLDDAESVSPYRYEGARPKPTVSLTGLRLRAQATPKKHGLWYRIRRAFAITLFAVGARSTPEVDDDVVFSPYVKD